MSYTISPAKLAQMASIRQRQVEKARLPVGSRFGALTVIGHKKNVRRWDLVVKCDCGVEKEVIKSNLLHMKSCGCLTNSIISAARIVHGETRSPTWRSWKSMMDRCYLRSHKSWKDYGGRGITVSDEYREYGKFKASLGERPAGTQLDRINNNLGYFHGNCRWATPSENANNRRNGFYLEALGERLTVAQWSRRVGIRYDTIRKRVKKGWEVAKALSTPVRKLNQNGMGK